MAQKSRELSQFSSFLEVDNTNKNIGIATTATPYVGIGTTNPQSKVHVVGDANIFGNTNVSGAVSATSYYLNGSPLVNAAVQTWDISGSDTYRLTGNVGIGTSVPSEKLEVFGNAKATRFISTETTLPPFAVSSTATVTNLSAGLLGGKSAPSGNIVGTTDTQELTNKTLSSPGITSNTSLNLGQNSTIVFEGSTVDSNKTTISVVDPTSSRSINFPNASGTVLTTGNITDITSGSITSAMIADGTIVNADISAGAGITYGKLSLSNSIVNADIAVGAGITYGKLSLSNSIVNADISASAAIANGKLANSTISGISLGSNLATLTFGTYLTGTSYNGSTAVSLGLNASPSDTTGNTVVVRSNGDFSAKTITATTIVSTNGNFSGIVTSSSYRISSTEVIDSSRNLINIVNGNFSGIVTCTDLNSTSDVNLKENIQTIDHALETINSIRGVSFNWKETQKPSVGVIAQEIESILPQLVNTGDHKSVNYNGLIGVLIEAVKELSAEVQELKSQLNK